MSIENLYTDSWYNVFHNKQNGIVHTQEEKEQLFLDWVDSLDRFSVLDVLTLLHNFAEQVDEEYYSNGYQASTENGVDIAQNTLNQEGWLFKSFVEESNEKTFPFTYATLTRKLDWETFCGITGVSYYAKNEGFQFDDREIFEIKESIAKKYHLI